MGALLTTWSAHQGAAESIRLCPDANSVLTMGSDFVVKHWALSNGDNSECKKMWRLKDEDAETNQMGRPLLCLGPKGYFAVSESTPKLKDNVENPTIQEEHSESAPSPQQGLFNVLIKNIDEQNQSEEMAVGGHSKMITALDWHTDSNMLATCSLDGTLRTFEMRK